MLEGVRKSAAITFAAALVTSDTLFIFHRSFSHILRSVNIITRLDMVLCHLYLLLFAFGCPSGVVLLLIDDQFIGQLVFENGYIEGEFNFQATRWLFATKLQSGLCSKHEIPFRVTFL